MGWNTRDCTTQPLSLHVIQLARLGLLDGHADKGPRRHHALVEALRACARKRPPISKRTHRGSPSQARYKARKRKQAQASASKHGQADDLLNVLILISCRRGAERE
eukprot:5902750-Pleurochrysis_carterae.AAC.1